MKIIFLSPRNQTQKIFTLCNTNPNIKISESSSTSVQPTSPFHMPLSHLNNDYTKNNSVNITYDTLVESDTDNHQSSMTPENEQVISEPMIIQWINDQSSSDQIGISTSFPLRTSTR